MSGDEFHLHMDDAYDENPDIISLSALLSDEPEDSLESMWSHVGRNVNVSNVNVNDGGGYFYAVAPPCNAPSNKASRPACPLPMCSGVGQVKSGANADGTRYCYFCLDCGTAWNQKRPSLLAAGQDPMVDLNCKRAFSSDATARSGGYACRRCGRKKNKKRLAPGDLPCLCPRKADATTVATVTAVVTAAHATLASIRPPVQAQAVSAPMVVSISTQC